MAVQYNRLNVLDWLKKQDLLRNIDPTRSITCISPAIIRWLHVNMPGIRMKIRLTRCSTEKDFEFMKWTLKHESVYEMDGVMNCINDAAANGCLLQLQWLHEHRSKRCQPQMLAAVILNEQLEIAKWLLLTYPEGYFDDPVISWFTPLKHTIETWLAYEYQWKDLNKRQAWTKCSTKIAVEGRDSDSLGFFLEIQTGANCFQAMQSAVDRGDLKMAKMLIPHQAPVSVFSLDMAATCGHLEMIQWLYDNAPLNGFTRTKRWAVRPTPWIALPGGHLEMNQWLHTHRTEGCTKRALEKGAGRGYLDIVEWMHENRTEGCRANAMDEAVELGHLDVVQWLHTHRSECYSGYAMDTAAAGGYLDIVKYLHENGLVENDGDGDQDAVDAAASRGNLEMVRFFHEQRHSNCSSEGFDGAAFHCRLDVVTWIHDNNSDVPLFEGLYGTAQQGDYRC